MLINFTNLNKINKNKNIAFDLWNLSRIISSSRILSAITFIIIISSLSLKLDKKNKKGFLIVSCGLLLYLWLNLINVIKRTFDKNFSGYIKLEKILLIFVSTIFIYSLLYYAIYNYDNTSFTITKDYQKRIDTDSTYKMYFDMSYFSINILTNIAFDTDIIPNNRIVQFIVVSQIIISLLLILILLARAI
jgi:hypothetical protein